MSDLFNNVKVGDTVHYSTPQGQSGKGKVVIHSGTLVVLNPGGKYGRPQVVTDKNYIKHSRDGKVVGALLSRLSQVREGSWDKEQAERNDPNYQWNPSKGPAPILKKLPNPKAKKVADAIKAGNKLSPYKLGEPQMNAAKAFGWVKEGRNSDADADEVEAKRPKAKGKTVSGKDPEKGWVGQSKKYHKAVEKARKGLKEEIVNELDKSTLDNYHYKAFQDFRKNKIRARNAHLVHDPDRLGGADGERADSEFKKAKAKVKKRAAGILMARKKLGISVSEMRNPSGPYGGDPYDWDPTLRKAIFAAAAERVKKLPGSPQPNKLDTGRTLKSKPQPFRRGVSEDSHDLEGKSSRVAKTKKAIKHKKLHELNTSTLAAYVSKSIADRKKQQGMADMARRIYSPERSQEWVDKTTKKADKRSKGIKVAVAKIAKAYEETEVNEAKKSKAPKAVNWQSIRTHNYSVLKSGEGGMPLKHHMERLAAAGIPSRKAHSPYVGHTALEVPAKHERKASKILYREEVYIDEQPINEVSAPGKEAWIKANKARFIERYGKEKGLRVLYAKAWKDVKEARENEWTANQQLAGTSNKPAKGHYLMRDGRRLSGPHTPEQAVGEYKKMSDSKGVKIVHVKEAADKVKKAAEKAISLAKKAKGNKHVDTQPSLDLQDKGGGGPMGGSHEGPEGNVDAKV